MKFDINEHLNTRSISHNWLTVEIGPRSDPMFNESSRFYTENNCYVGTEVNLRDIVGFTANKNYHLAKKAGFNGLNCFFIDVDSRAKIRRVPESVNDSYIENPADFRCESVLEACVANEVCISNVLSDPMINRSPTPLARTVEEIVRLLMSGGFMIRRETITPNEKKLYVTNKLAELGLSSVGIVELSSEPDMFHKLELTYKGPQKKIGPCISPHSFYQFLQKNES